MEVLGIILLIVGVVLSIIGGIWFIIVTFREGILWGLGSLFIPFVSLVFLITHWNEAGKPFGISLLGSALAVIGTVMAPGAMQ